MIRIARYPGAAIAAGAIGGLMGGWFKLGWDVTWPPRTIDRIPEPTALVTMFTHAATPVWISLVIHFALSILCGIAYAALAEWFPIAALGSGVLFGIAVWIGAREFVMPLLGLTPPAWRLPAGEQGAEFFGYALWGFVIGVFVAYCRPRFVRSVRLTIPETEIVAVPIAESVTVF